MTFIDVQVEAHDDLPDGCSMRFKAHGEIREVARLRYESEQGLGGEWCVEAAHADGTRGPAHAAAVEDSSAGSSVLIFGGARGLRLASADGTETVAEPYLLLSDAAVLD